MRELRLDRAQFLALAGDVLNQQGCFEFRAGGSSMHPTIRNGDVVLVQRMSVGRVVPGVIILYRDIHGRAVLHRVIDLYKERTAPIFLVCGDAHSYVEQVTSEQILGVAVAIRRGSIERSLKAGSHWSATLKVVRARSQIVRDTRWLGAKVLAGLQSFPVYRGAVKHLTSSRIHYVMADEEGRADQIAAANRLQIENQSAVSVQFITAAFWNLTVGSVTLVEYPDNDRAMPRWWITDLWVHQPFRRTGIGQRLTDLALTQAKAQGADAVHLHVFADNHPAIQLYEHRGFAQVEPIWLAQKQDAGRHRMTIRYPFTPN